MYIYLTLASALLIAHWFLPKPACLSYTAAAGGTASEPFLEGLNPSHTHPVTYIAAAVKRSHLIFSSSQNDFT